MTRTLFAFGVPWDKFLGPILTAAALAIVGYARKVARAAEAMKRNIDSVPVIRDEVRAAHTEAAAIGEQFAAFARESRADRDELHSELSQVHEDLSVHREAVGAHLRRQDEAIEQIKERVAGENALAAVIAEPLSKIAEVMTGRRPGP